MADIFADLLAQCLGSIPVVQPLLPSLFAPVLPSFISDVPLLPPDNQAVAPSETAPFISELLSLSDEEVRAMQTDLDESRSPQRPTFSPAIVSSGILPDSVSSLSLRHLSHSSPPVQALLEPGQQERNIQPGVPAEVFSITPRLSVLKQDMSQNKMEGEAEPESSFLPSNNAKASSREKPRQATSLGSKQQLRLQNDEISWQDNQAPYPQKRVLERHLLPIPANLANALPQPSSPTLAPQTSSAIQAQIQRASFSTLKYEKTGERMQQSEFASLKTLLRGQPVHEPSQVAPVPDAEYSLHASPLPFTREEMPGEVTRPALASSLREQTTEMQIEKIRASHEERPGEMIRPARVFLQEQSSERQIEKRRAQQIFNQTQKPVLLEHEPSVAHSLLRQEMPGATEEGEASSIRVHIGRVVVRGMAVSPRTDAEPTAKRMPRPALSLNEYLKQREKESR